MDPGNAEYETYLSQLESGGRSYQQAGGYSQSMNVGRWCMSMLLLNMFCNLCCRVRCC